MVADLSSLQVAFPSCALSVMREFSSGKLELLQSALAFRTAKVGFASRLIHVGLVGMMPPRRMKGDAAMRAGKPP